MGLEIKHRVTLKLNYKLFMDMHFLREGAFRNVPSGTLFFDGGDMSLLLPDTEADMLYFGEVGHIFQSPFRQWIYESGVVLDGTNVSAPPINVSGIYAEGAFRGAGDPEFAHVIDYLNGRVVFEQAQPLTLTVNVDFAYREVRIGFEHEFNQQYKEGFLDSQYMTNPLTSNQLVYPSGVAQPFPAVFIEVDERRFSAYEIGNRSLIIHDNLKFWVWAPNDLIRDNIVDIITSQQRKAVPLIDFNIAPLPLSGIFNTLSPEYVPYQDMLRNNVLVTTIGSGHPVRLLSYIDETISHNLTADEEYERAQIECEVATYLNAPTTPLGHVFGPISRIPVINDPPFPTN